MCHVAAVTDPVATITAQQHMHNRGILSTQSPQKMKTQVCAETQDTVCQTQSST